MRHELGMLAALLLGSGVLFAVPVAAKNGRLIEIRWYDDQQNGMLEVRRDCENEDCPATQTQTGPNAYVFRLQKDDRVLLTLCAADPGGGKQVKGTIAYTITSTDPAADFRKILEKVLPKSDKKVAKDRQDATVALACHYSDRMAVTGDLLAGGKLTVDFKTVVMEGSKNISERDKRLEFRIRDENPPFFASYGVALSKARDPEVMLIKTDKIITFTKNNQPQQAHEQKIALRDGEDEWSPLQSVVTLLNFRVYRRAFASLGFQLNQQVFKEPMFGASYLHRMGSIGLVFTGGMQLSEETEIVEASGFKVGAAVDPTLGLTVGDIPTETKYHTRLFWAFSIHY